MTPTTQQEGEPEMGYFLVGHGGSGDHGSEDRIRGICRVLPESPELFSVGLEEDWHYGLGALAGLNRHEPGALERRLGRGDWCLTARASAVTKLRRRGVRTVLWSGIAENSRELNKFYRILVSDRDSMNILRSAGLDKNLRVGPDPAFLVERLLRPLRGAFRQDTVGLCLSPAVCRFEAADGLLYRSYCHLIRWILDNTTLQIALIPYCAKHSCNDCLLLTALERQFREESRIQRREDGDCRVLRGDLSMCRCCVGTAGTLAAWSCGVPGICLGASSRAIGLARTLFGSDRGTVISVGSLKREADLTNRFRSFLRQEDTLRRRLEVSAAGYRQWAADWKWESIA